MKLRHLAVVAFTVMTVILTSGVAAAASSVQPSDYRAVTCTRYSYTPTIDGSPLDTLKLSMRVLLCYDGRLVWIPSNEKIWCDKVLVRKGSITGTARDVRCEPNGQGNHDRVSKIDPIYDVMEETPRGTATYQSWFTVNASGRITEWAANLWCDPPNLSHKCT